MSKKEELELTVAEEVDMQMVEQGPSANDILLQRLIDSKKLPAHVKSLDDAFTIVQMGKELGFPPMQALHYIIPIQGKLSLSAKAMGALLRRNKVKYETLEDALYVYPDGSTSDYVIAGNEVKPIDRRTTLLFERDGSTEKVSYTWKDATDAGYSTKDNWSRMPKEMLFARCLTKGANRIAPDVLFGLYNTDELFDVFDKGNIKVRREEDGTIAEILD